MLCIFFFQAEDGIRDRDVTGVQTCALPILLNTITKYDDFTPKGKTGLREYNRSDYSKKNEVQDRKSVV